MKDPDNLRPILEALGSEYELIRELGKGTTAIVYLVRDNALGRDVALKVIRQSFGHDDEALARLEREARLVAQLHHPNIVKLYGTRQLPDGAFVLLIEHVPGRNLKELIRDEGPLPVSRVVGILKDVASALAYAHRRRIVHRDVKPENIYIDDEVGTARLADFGVARPWDRDTRLTLPGESLGTPAYMSPEQIDDAEVDGRTDLYSLGLVGYEILVGRHPWETDNLFSIIYKQKNEELPPLASLRQDVPPELVRILDRACRKNLEDRWASAEALLDQLEALDLRTPGTTPGGAPTGAGFDRVFDDDGPREWRPLDRPAPPPERGFDGAQDADAERNAEAVRDDAFDPNVTAWDSLPEREPPPTESVAPPAVAPPPPSRPTRQAAPASSDEEGDLTFPDAHAHGHADAGRWPPPPAPGSRGESERKMGWVVAVLLLAVIGLGGGWYVNRGGGADAAPAPRVGDPPGETLPPPTPLDPASAEQDVPLDPELGRSAAVLRMADSTTPTGEVGETVDVLIRVEGPGGRGRGGVPVAVRVAEGEGSLNAARVLSDDEGLARVPVRLPPQPGTTVLMARSDAPGADPGEIAVRVVALPGPPLDVRRLLGNGQSAPTDSVLADPVGLTVRDAFGNPLGGLAVTFAVTSGGGQALPSVATTDPQGRAFARWRLGASQGAQALVATVEGAPDLALTFGATATGAPTAPPPEPDRADEPAAPTPPTVVSRPYAVGGTIVCGLRGGSPSCRGANDRGQRAGSGASGLVAIAPGVSHVCALDAVGQAYCWGANESGQLGDGTRSDRALAVSVSGEVRYSQLAAGLSHSCGLDGGGAAWCWGRNLSGQLGDGSRDDHALPRRVQAAAPFRRITAGWNHSCALDTAGRAWCWGLNGDGQLGDGSRLDRLGPSRVAGIATFQEIVAGSTHSCALGGGDVFCWGANGSGQLGDGTTTGAVRPVEVPLPTAAARVTAGALHSCVLLVDGRVFCWGQNIHGQLGDGSREARTEPTEVAGDLRFRTIEAGGGLTCGVSESGGEYCWGFNQDGQLGDGSRTNRTVPTRTAG